MWRWRIGMRMSETPMRCPPLFNHHNLIGCLIAGGNAMMWTDLRADENGFCRFLIRDIDLHSRQAGRSVQRLLEIHTYTGMALLPLPVAQEATPKNRSIRSDANRHYTLPGNRPELGR